MRAKIVVPLVLVASMAMTVFIGVGVATGQTVLHLVVEHETVRARAIDNYGDGLRMGDRIAARGVLTDELGAEAGMAYLDCVVQRHIRDETTGLWNCSYVLELEDGDLILRGLDPRGPGVYEMAVLGGTGAYSDASGEATFTDTADATDMLINLSS